MICYKYPYAGNTEEMFLNVIIAQYVHSTPSQKYAHKWILLWVEENGGGSSTLCDAGTRNLFKTVEMLQDYWGFVFFIFNAESVPITI